MHRYRKIVVVIIFICLIAVLFLGQRYSNERNRQMIAKALKSEQIAKEKLKNEAKGKSIYFQKNSDIIEIRNKYSKDEDIDVVWGRNGANSLFNFKSIGFTQNSDSIVSYKPFSTPTFTSSTDFFGPHIILAKNNINGDKPNSHDFTGGNHAFNGDANGKPTAGTTEIKVFADGKEVKGDFKGYANQITVEWTNKVQASNTKKSDGSGREVLEEHYKLNNNGEVYNVESQISFLEDIYWERYYGLQAAYENMWDENISFSDEGILTANKDNQSKTKLTKNITLNKGTNWLEIGLDNNVGIGNRTALKNHLGAFNDGQIKKAYFFLVDGEDFNKGDVVDYKGYYRFYSK